MSEIEERKDDGFAERIWRRAEEVIEPFADTGREVLPRDAWQFIVFFARQAKGPFLLLLVAGGLSGEDLMAAARMLKAAGCDMIDCSTGQTVPQQKPVYGRMYQASYADWVRNEVGIATMTVGAVTTPDQVNTLLASGKADLVALARPHLADPYFTLRASAWYQDASQYWPPQYLPGRDQAYRNAARERAELTDTKLRARPASHKAA